MIIPLDTRYHSGPVVSADIVANISYNSIAFTLANSGDIILMACFLDKMQERLFHLSIGEQDPVRKEGYTILYTNLRTAYKQITDLLQV